MNKDISNKKKKNDNLNNLKKYPPFSVAMSVYQKDNPEWFDIAFESITNQTVNPDEIVLVEDGPVPHSIESVVDKYNSICKRKKIKLNVIKLKVNGGLGNALKIAVENCTNELIARMDSDDIAVKNRFEQQLSYIIEHPEVDIIGGDIEEFIDDVKNIVGKRTVPCSDTEIKEYIKRRCPFNHMTVMYKKSAVLNAGGYLDCHYNEDYYLWIRMLLNNAIFANTGTVLAKARVGKEMYQRRGGKKYFKSEISIQKYMKNNKIIGLPTYYMNCIKRFIIQILLPNKIRGWVFRKFAREKINNE